MSTAAPIRGRVVVVGGGIAGLSATHALAVSPADTRPAVTLLEADGRLGGKVMTVNFGGLRVEAGPDGFLTRVPAAVELCHRLGLADELVAPGRAPAAIWSRGSLRPIPSGLVLGLPASPAQLARSGILSWRGIARAALEPLLPRSSTQGDISVADLVIPRFGRQVFDRLVDPLLSGIYAGRADQLSAGAVMPQLVELAQTHRSLLLGLRRLPRSREGGPALNSLSSGLETMVTTLANVIKNAVDIQIETSVTSVRSGARGTYSVESATGAAFEADAVIIAAPAYAASKMLVSPSPELSAELASISYASVATVALAYPRQALARPLDGSGFLVPRNERRLLVGSTQVTAKWPHLDVGDHVLLRCAVGRAGDDRWQSLDDEQLIAAVHAELAEAMGLRRQPAEAMVTRWPKAMPQYEVGHVARLRRIEEHLARLPGVFLASAAYRGIGLAACIQQGREAADKTVEYLSASSRLGVVAAG